MFYFFNDTATPQIYTDLHTFPDTTLFRYVHGDVDARRQRLHRADRAADVELGIRTAEARRVQRAGQDDGLAGDGGQHLCRLDHGVGAVGDQHLPRRLRGDRRAQKFAVLGGDVQRVLAQDRDHLEAERDAQVLEDAADLRLAGLVVGLVVEVHLVDGAAGGDDEKPVHNVSPSIDP